MARLTAASQSLLDEANKKKALSSDGKIYSTGGSGKNYVYNPGTGNIMVNGNAVKSGSSAYAKTLAAMQSDTGKKYTQADSAMAGSAAFGGTGASQNMTYQNYLDRAQQQSLAASNAGMQQQINSLQGQIPSINQTYQNVYKDLYQNQLSGQKNLPQLMAAQGLTGGATESTISEMQNNYANLLNQSKLAEQNALAEIRNQINNAQLTGTVTNANIASDYASQMAELQLQQQQLADERAYSSNLLADERKYNESLMGKERQADIYQQLLGMGIVNHDIADYYGTTQDALRKAMTVANTKSVSRSGGGGSYSSKTKGLTYPQAMAAYNQGIKTPAVISVLNSYLGDDWAGETTSTNNTGSVSLPAQSTDNVLASIKKRNPMNITSLNQMMLEQAYSTGQINDTQLKTLAKQLGVIIK